MNELRTVGVKLGTMPDGGAYPPDGGLMVPGELLWYRRSTRTLPGILDREEPADTHGWIRVRVDRVIEGHVLVSHP